MTPLPALRSSVSGGLARLRDGQARVLIAGARLAHNARLAAAGSGLRPKEIAVLSAGDGAKASGLFSEAASILGLLEDFERRPARYAGIQVEFDAGLYLDPGAGRNWWEYYFEPVRAGAADGPRRKVSHYFHDFCAHRIERSFARDRAAELVQRYVIPRPTIRAIVDRFVSANWRRQVIGVHYRGTDKFVDARRVAYDEVERAIRERIHAPAPELRFYVATDEDAFVAFMRERFPGQVLVREMFRSSDGRPIDIVNDDSPHQRGLDAVVDCLLLSRTHSLVRTASNLGLFATFFNPRVPVCLLNPER